MTASTTFSLAAPTPLATVDLGRIPGDLVEVLAVSGAVLHLMERPPGTYTIQQAADGLGATLTPA